MKRTMLFESTNKVYYEIEDVAKVLGKSPQTIRNWIASRSIPYIRLGNRNVVLRESLEAWLKNKEIKSWQ